MSASKWPRIKWNQANARLANAPFENLFGEQERTMSALGDVGFTCYDNRSCRYEDMIAQLRAALQAAQERSAEQARQIDEAHRLLYECAIRNKNERGPFHDEVIAWLAANSAPEAEQQP